MSKNNYFLNRIPFREAYLATRSVKAEKILKILRQRRPDLTQAAVLDIGCSRGHITECLARQAALVIGVDCDLEEQLENRSFHFIQADGCRLPMSDATFDVVVINHILEHVTSPRELLDEVWRVLKPDGIAYLACPNRLSLIEPHYRLPLLSCLPRTWANRYVLWMRRGECYRDNPPHYWELKSLTQHFMVIDQTLSVLKQADEFLQADSGRNWLVNLGAKLPLWFLKLLLPLMPVWIVIL
jgi:ubiquinone/menaquinone biosynthesis C-methylase UbiE